MGILLRKVVVGALLIAQTSTASVPATQVVGSNVNSDSATSVASEAVKQTESNSANVSGTQEIGSNSGSVSIESVIKQVTEYSEVDVNDRSSSTESKTEYNNSTEVTESSDDDTDITDLVMKTTVSVTDDGRRIVPVNLTHSGLQTLMVQYPSGSYWSPDNYYMWMANSVYKGGYGCAGFAYMLSDAVFGDKRATKIYGNSDIQQYDCVELFNNEHTAFVLEVNGDGTITVAEGNVNSKVFWGSIYYISDVSAVLRR
jgi:hypothetical protein